MVTVRKKKDLSVGDIHKDRQYPGSLLSSKVIELVEPGKIVVREQVLDIAALEDGQIAAKTLYSAISPGTEVAAYVGDPPLRPGKAYPRVVGYCNVAEVIAVGKKVDMVTVGDRIITQQSHRSHFICPQVCAPRGVLCRIPAGVDLISASTTYLFHLGYDALLKGGYKPGFNVGIIGLGTLGVATMLLSRSLGANVFAFSGQASGIRDAEHCGCRAYLKTDKDIRTMVMRDTHGIGLDMVITTSNSWEDWKLALEIAGFQGRICVIGFPGRAAPLPDFNPLDSQYFYDKQLQIVSCGYAPDLEAKPDDLRFTVKRNCTYLLDLIIKGDLDGRKLVSGVVGWKQIREAYDTLSRRKKGIVTYVIDWTED